MIPTLTTAMKWFPGRKGTAMGFVVGGFGGGALAFNQIQTAIVNPNNVGVRTALASTLLCFFVPNLELESFKASFHSKGLF